MLILHATSPGIRKSNSTQFLERIRPQHAPLFDSLISSNRKEKKKKKHQPSQEYEENKSLNKQCKLKRT